MCAAPLAAKISSAGVGVVVGGGIHGLPNRVGVIEKANW